MVQNTYLFSGTIRYPIQYSNYVRHFCIATHHKHSFVFCGQWLFICWKLHPRWWNCWTLKHTAPDMYKTNFCTKINNSVTQILLSKFCWHRKESNTVLSSQQFFSLTIRWYNMNHGKNVISDSKQTFFLHMLHIKVMHFVV